MNITKVQLWLKLRGYEYKPFISPDLDKCCRVRIRFITNPKTLQRVMLRGESWEEAWGQLYDLYYLLPQDFIDFLKKNENQSQ